MSPQGLIQRLAADEVPPDPGHGKRASQCSPSLGPLSPLFLLVAWSPAHDDQDQVVNVHLAVEPGNRLITLDLEIDIEISQVMEYFEIFLSRMRMCRRSAKVLHCDFRLIINQVQVM